MQSAAGAVLSTIGAAVMLAGLYLGYLGFTPLWDLKAQANYAHARTIYSGCSTIADRMAGRCDPSMTEPQPPRPDWILVGIAAGLVAVGSIAAGLPALLRRA